MRNVRIALLALALILIAIPAAALDTDLGVAGNYNMFVFGNVTATNSDIQGRTAVGGNAAFSNYSVNSNALPGNGLVVQGNLNYGNGEVHGNVRVGGTVTSAPTVVGGSLYTGASAQIPIDFSAEQTYLSNRSSSLAGAAATGTTVNNYGGLVLTGDGTSNTQVFNVDGGELLSSWGLSLSNVGTGSTVVINVSGAISGLTNMNMDSLANYDNIIFNFYEADELTLTGVAIYGTILAVGADVTGNNGQMTGTLIANSFTGGMEFHAAATPIPGAVWLLGTGLLGLVGLRRKFRD